MAKVENEKHFVGQIAQKAFIENEQGQVLLVQYPDDDPAGGVWDLPGGRLNEGEEPANGLTREVFEETGAEVSIQEIIATSTRVVSPTFQLFIVIYRATLSDPAAVLMPEEGEIAALKWHDKKDLALLPLIDANYLTMLSKHL